MNDACGKVFSKGRTMDWMWLVPQNLFVRSLTLNVLFWGRDGPFKRWSLVGYFDYWKASWGSSIIRFLGNVVIACCGLCFCCYNTVVMKSSLAHPGTMPLGFWKQKLHTLPVLKRLRLSQISSWRTEWCKKKVQRSGAVSCHSPPTISPTTGRV